MKIHIYIFVFFICCGSAVFSQVNAPDTTTIINLNEVIVTANRIPVLFINNPGSMSLVNVDELNGISKSIAVEEALRLVPGVRIDNQHDGERVHVSIRGQGILTERGLRGIGVILDGIPLNDPSGFAPDLYDVDWSTVNKIEVLRGPVAGQYGGGGAAGVINIFTADGGNKPFGGVISQGIGSNGFAKSLIQFNGYKDDVDYRISYSRAGGDGYRDHQAYWGNKLYEKINFHPNSKLTVTQIFSHADYFQQNPEGLNLAQFDNLLQANPDACPFNEYQKTNRTTAGIAGTYKFNEMHSLQVNSYVRSWQYKETSNKCAEYRNYTAPGASFQYNLKLGTGKLKNNFSIGADYKSQIINIYKLQSEGNLSRIESTDETNIENDSLLANQIINQSSYGGFAMYRLEYSKFNLFGSIRYDAMYNDLTNKMLPANSASTSKDFANLSARIGAAYSVKDGINVFVNWSQGFMPPSTEELACNPLSYSGFNTYLVPALSQSSEVGARGFFGKWLFYEVTLFNMDTENDFFRFKQSGRGNQEVFYGNAGNSTRKGIETYFSLKIIDNLNLQMAYTYSDFRYTSAVIDPVYTDTAYVLTIPPAAGQYLPNSPKHQFYTELSYKINKNFKLSVSTELQSKWTIYTDAAAYAGELDPSIYQNWQDGFNLYHAKITYQWNIWDIKGECSLACRNITGATYMAFTEPDPDGNSYQPGPSRELFASVKIKF